MKYAVSKTSFKNIHVKQLTCLVKAFKLYKQTYRIICAGRKETAL